MKGKWVEYINLRKKKWFDVLLGERNYFIVSKNKNVSSYFGQIKKESVSS